MKKSKKSCTCAGCLKKGAISTRDLHLYTKGLFYVVKDDKVVSSTLRFCPSWKYVQEIKSSFHNVQPLVSMTVKKKKNWISYWRRGACPFAARRIYSYRFSSASFIEKLHSPLFYMVLIYRLTLIWVEKINSHHFSLFEISKRLKLWGFAAFSFDLFLNIWPKFQFHLFVAKLRKVCQRYRSHFWGSRNFLVKLEFFFMHDCFSFVTFKDTITLLYNFQSQKWAWSLFPASGSTILENRGFKWLFCRWD